jgi:dTDP-4-amino-4,6-dideoxy-D-galactose acyltransferase
MTSADQLSEEEVGNFLPYGYMRWLSAAQRLAAWKASLDCSRRGLQLHLRVDRHLALARELSWDTAFFGRPIWKLELLRCDRSDPRALELISLLETRAREAGATYCFGMVPVEEIDCLEVLGRAGWSVVESRALFYCELEDFTSAQRHEVQDAQSEDMEALSRVAVTARNPYDRFRAEPFFSEEEIDRLMRTWVENSVEGRFADAVLRPVAGPEAFVTISHRTPDWSLGIKVHHIVLGATLPSLRGWYGRLISEACFRAREAGAEVLSIGTQSANRAVVRTCEKLGLRFGGSELVLRKILR